MNGLIEHDSLTSSDRIEPKHKFLFKLSLMLYYIAITLSVRPSVHTFVTDISSSTGRNDFIFDIWLWHGDLFHVSPFQVYRTSTSCLLGDLQMNEWGYSLHDIACNITSCFVSDGMTVFMETPDLVIFLSFLIRKKWMRYLWNTLKTDVLFFQTCNHVIAQILAEVGKYLLK